MDISTKLKVIEQRYARDLTDLEEKAFKAFCRLRWPPKGKPVCPRCGYRDRIYVVSTRRRFNCAASDCGYQFTPTMGTIFSSSKLSYTNIMRALELLETIQQPTIRRLADALDVHDKTAFVLMRKYQAAQGIILTDAAAAWKGYWQKPRPGRVVGPRGRRDGKRITT